MKKINVGYPTTLNFRSRLLRCRKWAWYSRHAEHAPTVAVSRKGSNSLA